MSKYTREYFLAMPIGLKIHWQGNFSEYLSFLFWGVENSAKFPLSQISLVQLKDCVCLCQFSQLLLPSEAPSASQINGSSTCTNSYGRDYYTHSSEVVWILDVVGRQFGYMLNN